MSVFRNLLMQTFGWLGKPADWSDIRKDCPENSIALYAGELGSNYIIEDGKLTWANPNLYLQQTAVQQYINTGYNVKSNTRFDLNLTYANGMVPFGAQTTGANVVVLASSNDPYLLGKLWYSGGASTILSSVYTKSNIYTEGNKIYANGVLKHTGGTPEDINVPLYLFARNNNGSVQYAANGVNSKIYSLDIYEGDVLVRSFRPVPSGLVIGNFTCPSDGMFDIVNQQFYGNSGTGTFTYGKDSVANDYDNLGFTATCTGGYNVFIDEKKYGTFTSGSQCDITWSKYNQNLPYGYTQVEYLQSSGTQYLDLGIKGNGTTKVEIKYRYNTATSASGSGRVFGSRTSSTNNAFAVGTSSGIVASSENKAFWCYDAQDFYVINDVTFSINEWQTIVFSATEHTLNSVSYGDDYTVSTFETPQNLKLFGFDNNGTMGVGYVDVEYCKLWDNGTLIRNLIPCKNSSNVLGMYDTVNDVFYENAGTGDFVGGNEVYPSITTGDIITTPKLLKAHKIWIEPATEGDEITAFKCQRVAESGTEAQGLLWVHFNISNEISLDEMLYNDVTNSLCKAITAKSDKMTITSSISWASGMTRAFTSCSSLEYVPYFITRSGQKTYWATFQNTKIKQVKLTQGSNSLDSYSLFENCEQLEQIKGDFTFIPCAQMFNNCRSLKALPKIDATSSTDMDRFLTNATALKNTVLNVSNATGLTKIGCYGDSSNNMIGFKGLRVSSSAPFDNATPPQINVSYTGMDRQALVTLFNDLPTVTGGQIIDITACTGSEDLSATDIAIATDKGWTVTGGPEFTTYYAYTDEQNNTLYATDSPLKTVALVNATNNGCTEVSEGWYQGGANKSIEFGNLGLNTANSWTFKTQFEYNGGGNNQYGNCIIGAVGNNLSIKLATLSDDTLRLSLSGDGYSWNITNADLVYLNRTLVASQTYYLEFGFTGTEYYCKCETTPITSETASCWSLTSSTKVWGSNSVNRYLLNYGYQPETQYFSGPMNLSVTSFTVDGVTTNLGEKSEASILYQYVNNEFVPLSPQPSFDILSPRLINSTNVGCTALGNGVYQGGVGAYIETDFIPDLANATTWEIATKYTFDTGQGQATVFGYGYKADGTFADATAPTVTMENTDTFRVYMAQNGVAYWNFLANFDTGVLKTGTTWMKLAFTADGYHFYYKKNAEDNYTDVYISDRTDIKVSCVAKIMFMNLIANTTSYASLGTIDMSETHISMDGITTDFYNASSGIEISSDFYERNPSGDLLG